MARPRIFLSSTYYDLSTLRESLEEHLKGLGYDVILAERGNITYGPDGTLPEHCYREVRSCDILLSVIGGRLGMLDGDTEYSISQREHQEARQAGLHVITFIDGRVNSDYLTFVRNMDNPPPGFGSVDDVRVLKFIHEIQNAPARYSIFQYTDVATIKAKLTEQLVGLVGLYLQQTRNAPVLDLVAKLNELSRTLHGSLDHLKKTLQLTTTEYEAIVDHPVVVQLEAELCASFRVLFREEEDLVEFFTALGFRTSTTKDWLIFERDGVHLLTGKPVLLPPAGTKLSPGVGRLKISQSVFDTERRLLPAIAVPDGKLVECEFEPTAKRGRR